MAQHDLSSRSSGRTGTRRRFLVATGGMASMGMTGCIGYGSDDDGDADDEVVIGSNHPLTGSLADTGVRMDQAVELAATIKNEAGGIESMDGAEVQVVSADNEGQQELGSEAAQELLDDGADAMTGCFSSPVTEDATRVAESERLPFVISAAIDANILQESPLEYVYRPQPSSQRVAMDHVELFQSVTDDHASIDTAGIFYLDNTYGQSVRNGLHDALAETDIDLVEEAAISFGQTAETHVTQFRSADPDVIMATTFENETFELVSAMEDQDYEPPFFTGVANAALATPSALEEMGEFVNGAFQTGYNIAPGKDRTQSVIDRYASKYGDAFDNNVGIAYAATTVILEAIEAAGSTDPDAINESLETITVEDHILAMGPITFQDDGENENAAAALEQIQNLEGKIVAPQAYAQAEPIL